MRMKTCNGCSNFQVICKNDTQEGVLDGQCIEFNTPETSDTKACYMFDNGDGRDKRHREITSYHIKGIIMVGGDYCYNRRTGYTCPYYDDGDNIIGNDGDNYSCSCKLFRLQVDANKWSNVTPHDLCIDAMENDMTIINADHSTAG